MSNQPTTAKSAERVSFLEDVLSTAVEGGINSWCQIESWSMAATAGRTEVTVVGIEDDDTTPLPVTVGLNDLARALGLIGRGETNIAGEYVKDIMESSRENDAGEIDAWFASMIFEVALFGNTVYS